MNSAHYPAFSRRHFLKHKIFDALDARENAGTMNEGALTLGTDGTIFYCNARFAQMVDSSIEKTIGQSIQDYIAQGDRDTFASLFELASRGPSSNRISSVAQSVVQSSSIESSTSAPIRELGRLAASERHLFRASFYPC